VGSGQLNGTGRSGELGRKQEGIKAAHLASLCPPSAPGPVSQTLELAEVKGEKQERQISQEAVQPFRKCELAGERQPRFGK
jgi:hypothetical protein